MKRLILILIISLVLSQTNYEKEEVNSGIKYENVILGCRPSKRCIDERCKIPCGRRFPPTRPKTCGPGEKLIDGKCYIPKPTCKPGEVYNNGKCEIRKPKNNGIRGIPHINRCHGKPCLPHPIPRCGPGEIRIGGKCQKKTDDVPKEE